MKPKPSERIQELLNIELAFSKGGLATWADYAKCIVEYLDEQWEAQNKDKQ